MQTEKSWFQNFNSQIEHDLYKTQFLANNVEEGMYAKFL